jgi:DNA-binding CsgD family transcriptional regulator
VAGPALPVEGRLLAAADFYLAKTEPRPHRAAADAAGAAASVQAEVRAGRLDGDAASAVLKAAGHRIARRAARPAGLTSREVEVLRLLAMGLSNREIAGRLVISPKTASHHVEHIYAKTGAANRAMASLFAATHGLIGGLPEAELRLKNEPVPGAEQPHPADPAVRGRVVVGLLLDQVVAVPGAHPQPVGDVPAPGHLAGRERAQLVDPGRGEPAAEDDLHGHLSRRPRPEVPAGSERLKVDRVRQHGAQGRRVLGRDRPGERLARGFHRLPPAVSS